MNDILYSGPDSLQTLSHQSPTATSHQLQDLIPHHSLATQTGQYLDMGQRPAHIQKEKHLSHFR